MPWLPRSPAGPVQLAPPGLMGMLQLKTQGFNPDALMQTVQPTIDMEGYWKRATRKPWTVPYSRALAGPGTQKDILSLLDTATSTTGLGPTPNEWWYIHNYTVECITGGDITFLQPGYTCSGGVIPGGRSNMVVGSPTLTAAGTTAYVLAANDFWLPPASALGIWVGELTTVAGVTFDLEGLIYSSCPL